MPERKSGWSLVKRGLYWILIWTLLFILCFSLINLYTSWSTKEISNKAVEELETKVVKDNQYLEPDWESLKKTNPEIIGWIYIPGTSINYPVVQKQNDNIYYLTHNAMLWEDELGAVFMNGYAKGDFSEMNTVIYGHSVIGGGMLTELKDFTSEEFFEKHPYYYLLTPSQNYKVMVYTFARTTSDSVYYTTNADSSTLQDMASKANFSRSLTELKWKGFSNPEVSQKSFVTLSTCDMSYGMDTNHRYVLTGMLKNCNKKKIKIEN